MAPPSSVGHGGCLLQRSKPDDLCHIQVNVGDPSRPISFKTSNAAITRDDANGTDADLQARPLERKRS